MTRLDTSARSSYWLEQLRGYFTKRLEETLPPRQAGLARALLLGDGSAMSRDDWDAFARTGVVHVLAISGQHLVILSGFLGLLFRMVQITPRRGAWVLIVVILGYALLTGARPSAMRAAVMVVCVCGGWLLRRPIHLANTFALAWLIVLVLNPHDPFTSGCQLSFISVFTLIWLLSPWLTREPDPLERLLASARPAWEQHLRSIGWLIVSSYIITFVLLVVNAPIIMLRQNLVPPIGTLLGPPLVLFTTIALVVGFVLLLADGLIPLGFPLRISLAACDWLVQLADRMPGGTVYTTTPPLVWVIGFYLLLIVAILLMDRRVVFAWLAWVILGLIGTPRTAPDELRVTFLSVGHGGCTVIECPDGRVMLYDAGTMAGSSAVPRIIAPYLWHRGIARIDEVFLSHADLDHYNGVAALLKRFPVGQITLTPSFATKPTPQVASVLLAIREHRVPIRAAVTGQRFIAGEVTFEVLHPPPIEFGTSENERSLVLKCVHRQHVILLTGDVEKQGTQMLLRTPPLMCDVLMAPHHGSRSAMSAELLRWATPKLLVVSCGGRHDTTWDVGVPTWDTWTSGAITIRSQPTGLVAESFRRGERIVVQRK